MAEQTKIAWARSTMNPWIGCAKVGPGCDHCYAEQQDSRKRWGGTTHWGAGVPRMRTSQQNWNRVLRWDRLAAEEKRTGHITPKSDWQHPGYWPVFCASLADVFDNEVPDEWRHDLFRLIGATPYLSWLLVTKRIGNAQKMLTYWPLRTPPENVRILITICNQEEADRDIPKLLALPCKNGVSYEPALGAVDFTRVKLPDGSGRKWIDALRPWYVEPTRSAKIDWIICGGESGPKARTFDIQWARDAIAQCRDAGVPVFMKQTGTNHTALYERVQKHRAGADPSEWPADLRVREFPL